MDVQNNISMNFLDVLFETRNKSYGAYDLRVTYSKRIKRGAMIMFLLLQTPLLGFYLSITKWNIYVTQEQLTIITNIFNTVSAYFCFFEFSISALFVGVYWSCVFGLWVVCVSPN